MINFNKNLKKLRKNFNYTLKDIEKKTNIKSTILNQYEFSNKIPSYNKIILLAEVFNISIDYLILGNTNNFINYIELFKLIEKTNELYPTIRNQIENNIIQYIDKNKKVNTYFDNPTKYKLTNSVHKNIKIIREQNNLTQENLSKIIGLKTKSSILNIEKNRNNITFYSLEKISKKFGISIHYLITGQPLAFNIKDDFLFEYLIIFDKTATIDDIKTITNLIKRIYKNNNIKF